MIHYEVIESRTSYVTCDVCDKRTVRYRACLACQKHICPDHQIKMYTDPFTGRDAGDYPDYLCQKCSDLLVPFGAQATAIRKACDDRVEELENQWKDACKR